MLPCAKHQLQVSSMCSTLVQTGIEAVLEVPLNKTVSAEVNGSCRCKVKQHTLLLDYMKCTAKLQI